MPLKNARKQQKARKNSEFRKQFGISSKDSPTSRNKDKDKTEKKEKVEQASGDVETNNNNGIPDITKSYSAPPDLQIENNQSYDSIGANSSTIPKSNRFQMPTDAPANDYPDDSNNVLDMSHTDSAIIPHVKSDSTEFGLNKSYEQALTEDIYSLMSTMEFLSVGFLFPCSIFIIQLGILVLVLVDLIDMTNDPIQTNGVVNRLNIPADAGIAVTVAQFLGVILIVNFAVAEGDMIRGLTHLLDGHDPTLLKQYPHAQKWKWIVAGFCQTIVGAVMILDAFCLMMSGDAVINIILNFAALDFVQYFDDAAFALASMGLINEKIQVECLRVGKAQVQTRSRNETLLTKRLVVLLMSIGLFIPYFIIAAWKFQGRLMCGSLYVQFGDAYGPEWPYNSGVFVSPGKSYFDRIDGRLVYLDQSGEIQLAYCSRLKSWTFTNQSSSDELFSSAYSDPCDNYFIKSSESEGFDIMTIAGFPWYAQTPHMGTVPMDWMAVTCADCNENLCDPSVGTCVNNQCKCHDGYMGLTCEFDVPTCDFLGLDQRTKESLPSLPFASLFVENEFIRMQDESKADYFYDRPIYVSFNEEENLDIFIVFTGRRWVIMGVPLDKSFTLEEDDPVDVIDFLDLLRANDPVNRPFQTLQNISETLTHFVPLFFSAPMDYGTPSHRVDPVSATWFLAERDSSLPVLGFKSDDSRGVSPSFICSHCNDTTNPCQHGGFCNTTSTYCECPVSYGGFLCEYSYNCREKGCLNNGTCDEIFNICKDCEYGYYGNLCQFKRPNVLDYEVAAAAAAQSGEDFFLCFNGTTCLNGGWCEGNLTKCSCPEDFSGDFCEELHENSTLFSQGDFICANSTCINGGWCVGNSTECSCPPEFTGLLCEQTFGNTSISDSFFHCSNSTCLNDGYCSTKTDPCVCPREYEGDYCEFKATLIEGHALCKNETCQNGGYCTSILEVCTCPENYEGDNCEAEVLPLTEAPMNGTTPGFSLANDTTTTISSIRSIGYGSNWIVPTKLEEDDMEDRGDPDIGYDG